MKTSQRLLDVRIDDREVDVRGTNYDNYDNPSLKVLEKFKIVLEIIFLLQIHKIKLD